MARTTNTQWTITKYGQDTNLFTWIEAFLVDRKAQGLSEGTLNFYQKKLKLFIEYCEAMLLNQITEISPSFFREYVLYLEDTDHNKAWRYACFRGLKTFLYWWIDGLHQGKNQSIHLDSIISSRTA